MIFLTCLSLLACGPMGDSGTQAPAIEFNDLQGSSHTLAKPERPTLVGFFISNCGYCKNMMGVLNDVSAKHRDIEVYGFYLNPGSDGDISSAAQQYDFSGTVVAAQQRPELIQTLASTFAIRGPGRDAYVIDKAGAVHSVSLVDGSSQFLSQADVEAKLEDLIAKADGSSASAPAAGGSETSLIH
jgi:thiol-disulfide isomerase/thioredoxin